MTNSFAVHGGAGGKGRGNHMKAFLFELYQHIGGNGFDFGHYVVGLLLAYQSFKGGAIEHGNHIVAMSHLQDRKSTRLNSSHVAISYAVFCLKKKHYEIQ